MPTSMDPAAPCVSPTRLGMATTQGMRAAHGRPAANQGAPAGSKAWGGHRGPSSLCYVHGDRLSCRKGSGPPMTPGPLLA